LNRTQGSRLRDLWIRKQGLHVEEFMVHGIGHKRVTLRVTYGRLYKGYVFRCSWNRTHGLRIEDPLNRTQGSRLRDLWNRTHGLDVEGFME
jgi:hypothetical protein